MVDSICSQHYTKKRKFLNILVLGMITAIGPFFIDMHLPAFADITAYLHTTVGHVSLSLSRFFIGILLGQFIYGLMPDKILNLASCPAGSFQPKAALELMPNSLMS